MMKVIETMILTMLPSGDPLDINSMSAFSSRFVKDGVEATISSAVTAATTIEKKIDAVLLRRNIIIVLRVAVVVVADLSER